MEDTISISSSNTEDIESNPSFLTVLTLIIVVLLLGGRIFGGYGSFGGYGGIEPYGYSPWWIRNKRNERYNHH